MNSVNRPTLWLWLAVGISLSGLVLGGVLLLSDPAFSQENEPVSGQTPAAPAVDPATVPAAGQPLEAPAASRAVSDTPTVIAAPAAAEAVADPASAALAAPPSNEEVIKLLRDGNNGKPLSMAQLAAINDMIKRMEYLNQVESKMSEMALGGRGVAAAAAAPVSRPGSSVASGGSIQGLMVVRVIGVGGKFAALLSSGTTQMLVHEGDDTEFGPVARISLNAVEISAADGVRAVPFAAPSGLAGVSFGTGRR